MPSTQLVFDKHYRVMNEFNVMKTTGEMLIRQSPVLVETDRRLMHSRWSVLGPAACENCLAISLAK